MDTLGERLRYALQRKDWSIAEFQRQLVKSAEEYFEATSTPVPGVSRPMVFRYLKNEGAPPSLEWCFVAGTLLGLRPEWLTYGNGAPTEAEERRRLVVGHAPTVTVSDHVLAEMIEEAAEHFYIGEWQAASWSVHELYRTALEGCQDQEEITEAQSQLIVFGLYRALDFPVSQLGGSWDMVGNFIITTTGLFKMLLASERPTTLSALIEKLSSEYSPSITLKSDVFD